jgi:hypothetical protein
MLGELFGTIFEDFNNKEKDEGSTKFTFIRGSCDSGENPFENMGIVNVKAFDSEHGFYKLVLSDCFGDDLKMEQEYLDNVNNERINTIKEWFEEACWDSIEDRHIMNRVLYEEIYIHCDEYEILFPYHLGGISFCVDTVKLIE